MGREFELKYGATPESMALLRKRYAGWQEIAMETAYYDTPNGDLGERHWTLRRRYENGVSVCTVKTPAPGGGRGEWETECGDILEALPILCKLGGPKDLLTLTQKGLIQVCAAEFTRLACQIDLPGCTLELAMDRGRLLGGDREIPLCEIEVELKSGSEDQAVTFAQSLAAELGLKIEHRSKYRRALGLARGETVWQI